MPGPLDGIKVVEIGVWVAGPSCGAILADWGADVLKLEPPNGDRVIDTEWVRINLARVRAGAEVAELFNWRVASLQEQGELNPADASAMKVYGTELQIESLRLLMEVLGAAGTIIGESPGAVLKGTLEQQYRGAVVGTFGGGVNEIQRDIVATVGLGMTRASR